MNKDKVLQTIEDKIEWAKNSISKARENGIPTDIKYLSGHLEAYEGIRQRIQDGYWD